MNEMLNVSYGPEQEQLLDAYLPEGENYPVFVYFHGGGIERGSRKDEKFYEDLCRRGIGVVTADYRMYPHAKYPEFIKDCALCVKWVFENLAGHGKVFVGGSSAGGYLSMMLCFDRRYLENVGIKVSDISGFAFDAGQPTTHFNVLRERGLDRRRVIVDEAAPLYHIDGTSAYPPMLIIVADNDMQNRWEQTMLLMSTLKHFGQDEKARLVVMEGFKHCRYVSQCRDDGRYIFADMVEEFIKTNL